MTKLLASYKITVTPLSPFHIGCGETFDSTSFLVDDGILYGFNPSHANLSEDERQELLMEAKAERQNPTLNDLTRIQRFYERHKSKFIEVAQIKVPVQPPTIKRTGEPNYKDLYKKTSTIYRTAYQYIDEQVTPYIPGSSLKGCIRTALLDRLNKSQERDPKDDLDELVLEGTFSESPMFLLSVSDLTPENRVETRVIKTRRIYTETVVKKNKKFTKTPGSDGPVCNYCEVVNTNHNPQFKGILTLKENSRINNSYLDAEEIVSDLNRFYLPRLKQELPTHQFNKNIRNNNRVKAIQRGESPLCALIRIGKNTGSLSKVLSDIGKIEIKVSKTQTEDRKHPVTIATELENKEQSFGWALIEFEPL